MRIKLQSIKSKLLLGALFLTLNVTLLSGISIYHFQKISEINGLEQLIYQLQVDVLKLMRSDNNFITYDALNPHFFESGDSKILAERRQLKTQIDQLQALIVKKSQTLTFELDHELTAIDSLMAVYDKNFEELKSLLHHRGFKDFGLIGEMRFFAHSLESQKKIDAATILMLRRHEKDFQLRNDLVYASLFSDLIHKTQSRSSYQEDLQTLNLLEGYELKFAELVSLEANLGINNNTGLKSKIDYLNDQINIQITVLIQNTNLYSAQTLRSGNYIFFFSVAFAITISLLLSYIMAVRISKPLRKLSNTMDHFIIGASSSSYNLKNETSEQADSEIATLTNSFINLSRKVKSQFLEIKNQSDLLEEQNLQLKKVNLQLDRFVYAAAHDLRAPLTSVLGLINITERELTTDIVKGNFDMMRTSVLRLDALIKDMVDFSKNKRSELEIVKIDPKNLVEDIYNNQKHGANKPIKFTLFSEGNKDFYNDSKRVDIVLRNIISNSIKYADESKSESFINIWMETRSEAIKFIIIDNGIGIEPNYLPHVYGMFYRATEKSKGSGLGLFLVKETLDVLGGSIHIESSFQMGTTVTVIIPNLKKARKAGKELNSPTQEIAAA